MQKSYESGSATHIGPESCGAIRKNGVEALTGDRADRVFSRVRTSLRDADAVGESGRPHRVHRHREVCQSPARSETPCMYADTSRWPVLFPNFSDACTNPSSNKASGCMR